MLIADLVRLGRPLLDDPDSAELVLRLLADPGDIRVKNFYRHVFVVQLPADGLGTPRALPMQRFGDEDAEGDFRVDLPRAKGVPIALPTGGNPLHAQGRYGVPVYPCYEPHLEAFAESQDGVADFLRPRLARTPGLRISDTLLEQVARCVHTAVRGTDFGSLRKRLGVLALVRVGPGQFHEVGAAGSPDRIGLTPDGQPIVPCDTAMLAALWRARLEEGAEEGKREGCCTLTGAEGDLVSSYCKAWPWALNTWKAPFRQGGDERGQIESIALAPDAYRALTLGASVFAKLTRRVSHLVLPELFSPGESRTGRDQAQRRNLTDLPAVLGSALLLPAADQHPVALAHVRAVRDLLEAPPPTDPTAADRYFTAVTGFDVALPEEATDAYRLTLVYFSGDLSRGDVHLRAMIQDVLPSTLGRLRELARSEGRLGTNLLRRLARTLSDKHAAWLGQRYQSVPYLLARAYGGSYLWQQLEALLHHRPLGLARVTTNTARRLQSLVPGWPRSRRELTEEVTFYLHFLQFRARVNLEIAAAPPEEPAMKPWKELLDLATKRDVADLVLDDPADLGFVCGALLRRFGRHYYAAAKHTKANPDFLRDRVLTFGSDLRPDAILNRGLRLALELPERLPGLKVSRDLRERLGVTIAASQRLSPTVAQHKDEFLTAFWSGYALEGHDRPRNTSDSATTITSAPATAGAQEN